MHRVIAEKAEIFVIESKRSGFWFLFSWAASIGLFIVLAVASCTSQQTFGEIYNLVTEFLSLSQTTLSITMRESPGLGHFISYTLLSFFLTGVFSKRRKFMAPLLALGFGVLMESVQAFIPSREASWLDIGVNFLGVSLGFGVYWVWETYVRRPGNSRLI